MWFFKKKDKYEFIKERTITAGFFIYYTRKNGNFVPYTMSSVYDEAIQEYNNCISGKEPAKIEIIKTNIQ